uniref:Uncharacterized protein n=1 Tax=Anopheles quadriannulatus TaxID=34691 RepID=A0A182XT12_ANOQN
MNVEPLLVTALPRRCYLLGFLCHRHRHRL